MGSPTNPGPLAGCRLPLAILMWLCVSGGITTSHGCLCIARHALLQSIGLGIVHAGKVCPLRFWMFGNVGALLHVCDDILHRPCLQYYVSQFGRGEEVTSGRLLRDA